MSGVFTWLAFTFNFGWAAGEFAGAKASRAATSKAGSRVERSGGRRFMFEASGSEFHEILQQPQANVLALLGVKLRGEHVVPPHRRRKGAAVVCPRGDDRGIGRLWKE